MFLQQLFEAIDKRHAAFAFGRMNPPTLGHGQLIDTVANAAAGGDYFVFVSQTQDSKKNPLDYATKIKFIKAMFPAHAGHVVQDTQLKTIMQIAHWLYAKGYRAVTFVAGSDRIEGFTDLLNKYNGHGQEGDAGYYKFDTINVVSSGDRDPDAEGLAGVSATAAREAAAAGNLEAFAQATGAGELAEPLYTAVRKGMLLDEGWKDAAIGAAMLGTIGGTAMYTQQQPKVEIDGVKWTLTSRTPGILSHAKVVTAPNGKQYQVWRGYKNRRLAHPIDDKQVDESASGYIPKNKKEAKDPRWSHALTVDVKTDTPRKNMQALKLI
jgi:hypothetical protein